MKIFGKELMIVLSTQKHKGNDMPIVTPYIPSGEKSATLILNRPGIVGAIVTTDGTNDVECVV
jgi:hypothetical protein